MGGWARRPALDGLRAVALVLVLLSHGGVGFVGGAIGVDVFLVLSGYLITGLLLVELDATGRIDLRAFWGRRLRRLVPAALLLGFVVGLIWRPDPLDTIATLGWWANWRFALADTGYFSSFDAPSPLRHTWSLAVEEQWYLVWPPLVLLARRRGRQLALAAVLIGASVLAMWLVAADVDRAHMGTDARAHSLLVGAVVAMVMHGRRVDALGSVARATTSVAAAAGAAFVLAVSWRTPGTAAWLYRGGHLAIAVASAALVVAALRPSGPVRAVLAVRPLRAVGRLSYGAYLWHWPLFLWLTPDRTGLDPWPLLGVRCAATAAATLLSWHLVERPVLEGRPIPRPHLALPTAFAASLAVVLAANALDPAAQPSLVAASSAAPVRPAGFAPSTEPRPAAPAGVLDTPPEDRPAGEDTVVTVIGDSTGWALGWDVAPIDGIEVHDGGALGCGVDPADTVIGGATHHEGGFPVPCPQVLDLWRWWTATSDPDLVILAVGAWEVYDRVLPDGSRLHVGTEQWRQWLHLRLEHSLVALADAGPHARIAVTEVPCYEERDLGLGGPSSARNEPRRRAEVDGVVADVVAAHPARLTILPWRSWLCDGDAYQRPDGVHLVPESARALWHGPLGAWVRGQVATGAA